MNQQVLLDIKNLCVEYRSDEETVFAGPQGDHQTARLHGDDRHRGAASDPDSRGADRLTGGRPETPRDSVRPGRQIGRASCRERV